MKLNFDFVFFSEFKQFTWFIKKSRHSRENLITVKYFFHCLKLGNVHAKTRIVIELYDVTGTSEDSRRSVSLWRLTKKNARLLVLEMRTEVLCRMQPWWSVVQ